MSYKWCAVPLCTNTTIKTPEKLFITVPKNVKVRKKWFQLARRDPREIKNHSVIFFCQDHFDIEKDMANYYQYNMGLSQRILMTNGVVPTKFSCQEECRKKLSDSNNTKPVMKQRVQLKQEFQDSEMQEVSSQEGSSNIQPTAIAVPEVVLMTADISKNKQSDEETCCSSIKEEYYKIKLSNAKLERRFLIQRHKMEKEKHTIQLEILNLKRQKLYNNNM